jgi:hypothetical protein
MAEGLPGSKKVAVETPQTGQNAVYRRGRKTLATKKTEELPGLSRCGPGHLPRVRSQKLFPCVEITPVGQAGMFR